MSGMVERVARIFDEGAYLPEGAAGILMPRKVRRSDAEALACAAMAVVLAEVEQALISRRDKNVKHGESWDRFDDAVEIVRELGIDALEGK